MVLCAEHDIANEHGNALPETNRSCGRDLENYHKDVQPPPKHRWVPSIPVPCHHI